MEQIAVYFNADVLAYALPHVFRGFLVTVQVALLTIVIGIGTGIALALLRTLDNRWINVLVTAHVEVFRTLPQLVIIIFVYFGLPFAGIRLSPFWSTVLSLGLVLSAFACEILWTAINALPKGQWEAARALDLRHSTTLLRIILPQAILLAIPLMTNRAISISKGTALGTAVALPETLGEAQSVMAIMANPSPLTLAVAFYLLFFAPLVVFSRWLEGRVTYRGAS
jgi:polar amino acid transport system permease protein